MFKNKLFGKKNEFNIYSFASGTTLALSDVNDAVFSSHTLGNGIAVKPSGDTLYAPCDGKIDTISDTLHALTMTSDFGAEILLHIGIDTVNLKGKFFTVHVRKNQKIKQGDRLITFQRDKIEYEKYDSTICMAVCNSNAYKTFNINDSGKAVTKDDIIITIA